MTAFGSLFDNADELDDWRDLHGQAGDLQMTRTPTHQQQEHLNMMTSHLTAEPVTTEPHPPEVRAEIHDMVRAHAPHVLEYAVYTDGDLTRVTGSLRGSDGRLTPVDTRTVYSDGDR